MSRIPRPTDRNAILTGSAATVRRLHDENPELLENVLTQGLREAFETYGGLPDCLHATLGENTEILKRNEDGTSKGYDAMLQLKISAHEDYVQPHDEAVEALAAAMKRAWLAQHTDHAPGAFRLTREENGDYTLTVAHLDVAHLTSMVNRLLKQHALPSIDTRLMAMRTHPPEGPAR